MSVDYKVVENNKTYSVEEKATGYIIRTFKSQKEAKEYMKFLNLGGGFSGWTPSFILNSISKNM